MIPKLEELDEVGIIAPNLQASNGGDLMQTRQERVGPQGVMIAFPQEKASTQRPILEGLTEYLRLRGVSDARFAEYPNGTSGVYGTMHLETAWQAFGRFWTADSLYMNGEPHSREDSNWRLRQGRRPGVPCFLYQCSGEFGVRTRAERVLFRHLGLDGRKPQSFAEIAAEDQVTEASVERQYRKGIEAYVDRLVRNTQDDIEHGYQPHAAEIRRALAWGLRTTTPLTRQVVRIHFGTKNRAGRDLRSAGETLGISRERVRQILRDWVIEALTAFGKRPVILAQQSVLLGLDDWDDLNRSSATAPVQRECAGSPRLQSGEDVTAKINSGNTSCSTSVSAAPASWRWTISSTMQPHAGVDSATGSLFELKAAYTKLWYTASTKRIASPPDICPSARFLYFGASVTSDKT